MPEQLYEHCRYDGNPYPCDHHVGCYAAGNDHCLDVRTTVVEDERGRETSTSCHACGNGFGSMYEPRAWYVCSGDDACQVPEHWPDRAVRRPTPWQGSRTARFTCHKYGRFTCAVAQPEREAHR